MEKEAFSISQKGKNCGSIKAYQKIHRKAIKDGCSLLIDDYEGHADRETTKIYTHLHAEDLVEAVQAIKDKSSTVCNKSVTRSETAKPNVKKSS